MKKYYVRVKHVQGGLQPVLLFDPLATIEPSGVFYKGGAEDIEEYEVLTRFDLDRVLDLSPAVVEYTSEEV
jgi:hypothetical protein